ncbi:MAG: hypothetical protein RIT27_1737 [Pseudomonadota bacterium]
MYPLFEPWEKMQQQLGELFDPFGINKACVDVQKSWLANPQQLFNKTMQLSIGSWAIQSQIWRRLVGISEKDKIPAVEYDERFAESIWTDVVYLDYIKQYYLLGTRWLEDAIYETPDVDWKTREKSAFWVRQWLNAIAPTNYFWTNPLAVKKCIETGGESVLKGLKNLVTDLKHNTIRMVDTDAFEVGKNLALTTGEVVFRNELFELIQYAPQTEQTHQIPILFVPPWINKYYILDLTPKKSIVNWLVQQGFTVFLISWKNPTAEMRHIQFDDYLLKGVLPAIEVVKDICQVSQIHAVGYCIGGTLLSILMAWLNANGETAGENSPISSWTLFTTLTDFSNPGEIQVFIDEENLNYIDKLLEDKGYLDGKAMADSFRLLRSNSLIWHYFVHNYLYGEDLPAFDILFWNMDNTRLPQAMHSFYLRELYLHNKLSKPNELTIANRSLDLSKITQPLYDVSTEQDHIAPWKETFKKCAHISSPIRKVLATSGHILGIISPPVDPPKRRYWVGEAKGAHDPLQWREQQPKVAGSWWEDWKIWLNAQCGATQNPPAMGSEKYPPLLSAPGLYVFEK